MRGLSLILFFLLFLFNPPSESPHGKDLKISCTECHNSEGWKLDRNNITFKHDVTKFPLKGLHQDVDCSSCHTSLVFNEADENCVSCHTDMHEQSVGMECDRCHTPNSWIVDNITEIHQMSRFPLLGAHNTADCFECHDNSSTLVFGPLEVDCFSCHQKDYVATTSPNHVESAYSTDCTECHQLNAFSWTGANFTHAFFPLTQGHDIRDCSQCHKDPNDYSNISSDCISCHQNDYNNADSPNHLGSNFPTDCKICHTTAPGWKPADFANHDAVFPIYSGKHKGEWNSCTDCHNVPNNYSIFTCISCHEHSQSDMNHEHDDVGGYIYNSNACFECHPTGSADNVFNHNSSNFPLTGAHATTDCKECHVTGYSGTTTDCGECHITDYNQTSNPNHVQAELSLSCADCHTTVAGWKPADFRVHDNLYFPIYSGEHRDEWNECVECHTSPENYLLFTCIDCHEHNQVDTDDEHNGMGGYIYNSNACFECHPTGSGDGAFDHNTSNFPLTGAHTSAACVDCHSDGYTGTPTYCAECHIDNYNQTTNPNHTQAGLSDDCAECHTTLPEWKPAKFTVHDNLYFPIYSGKHRGEWDNCIDCHLTPENYSLFSCIDCHEHNQSSTNGEHNGVSGYIYNSQACFECHPDGNGDGAFNHSTSDFPLTGAHVTVSCENCHINGYAGTPNECFECHTPDFNGTTNPNHQQAGFSNDCASCHTSNPGWTPANFDHSSTGFAMTGAHASVTCASCHTDGYNGTSSVCFDCHTTDFNQTTNPNHLALSIDNDCSSCHTTQPDWQPATFDIHNNYYILAGAHVNIANECVNCHNGNYNNTPNTCYACHTQEYNQTNDPPHASAQFSTECLTCHTQTAWTPSTFNHDAQYFPIYSGKHKNEWNTCSECHTNPNNYAIFSCIDCHEHNNQSQVNNDHNGVPGYQYNSIACLDCHPNGQDMRTIHHQNNIR